MTGRRFYSDRIENATGQQFTRRTPSPVRRGGKNPSRPFGA
jgi:hypothetical protein